MKTALPLSLLLALSLCVSAHASSSFDSKVKYPRKTIMLNVEDTPALSVSFDHSAHDNIGCDTCHHKPRCAICHFSPKLDSSPYASCSTVGCHPREGRSMNPDSRFMAFHKRDSQRSCFGCHVAEGNADGCRPCHSDKPAN